MLIVKKSNLLLPFVAALLLAPCALASAGPVAGAVLGSDGELYRLVAGTYGEMSGVAKGPESAYPVLALRIQQPDGEVKLELIPQTVGPEVENSPFLIYENASRTVFLAWEERINHIHSRIRLIGYSKGEWTEVLNVSEGAFGFKGAPRLATTRDSFVVLSAEGKPQTVTRTTLHVVWVEEHAGGQAVAYAPVTLIDGKNLGQNSIFDLSAMLPSVEPIPVDLWATAPPAVDVAEDDHSVIVGFVDSRSGRFASLRITLLPGELSMIADELRNHLIDVGVHHDWQSPEGLERLAEGLRNHLIDIGQRLDPEILRHIASDLRNHLIDIGVRYQADDLRRLASDLRNHLIDVGFRLDERGLRRVASAAAAHTVIEVAGVSGEIDETRSMSQVARVTAIQGWERPSEATRDSILMLSRNGQEALVSWSNETSVFYRETFDGKWSTVHRLPIGRGLDATEALAVLQNRIRNR
jgi:hypothetical protein